MAIKNGNGEKKLWWQTLLAAHGGTVTLAQLAKEIQEDDIEFLRFCAQEVELDPTQELDADTLPILLEELEGWHRHDDPGIKELLDALATYSPQHLAGGAK
jgi:hypothetical protein